MIGVGTTIFLVNPATFPSTSYLLDTYSASAAYSLRQLKTGVTNVVRVRRSSDNAEQDFTATDITDGTLTTWTGANDGFVTVWYNQDGTADLSGVTASEQPKLVSSGTVITKGGKPTVQFDGSNDNLRNHAASFINTTNTSYFSVSAARVTGTVGAIHIQYSVNNQTIRTFVDARTTPNRNLVIGNTGAVSYFADLSAVDTSTNLRLLSSFIDGSKNMSGFDNGATGGTDTYTGTTNSDGLRLGSQIGANYLDGYISEFIAFNTDETANRTAIESDINAYYSIY